MRRNGGYAGTRGLRGGVWGLMRARTLERSLWLITGISHAPALPARCKTLPNVRVFHQLCGVSWFECCRPARVLPARPGPDRAIPRDDYPDDTVELVRGPTNWRRGFFRLWLLASLMFIVAVAVVAWRDIDPQFENLDLPGLVAAPTKFVPRGAIRPAA